jgi:lambda family phage portal protein
MAKASTKSQAAPAAQPTVLHNRARNMRGYSVRSAFFNGTTAIFSAARTFFEAASNAMRLIKAVDSGPNSANGEIERVRMRSRWNYANDPHYRQACRQVPNNIVHYGIKPVIKDKALLRLWKRWVKEADVRGKMDFYAIQWALALSVARDGEALVRFRDRREGDTRSGINFQLQLMEADHLPLGETRLEGDNRITSGVEQNAIERVVAYWLLDYHPKDTWQGHSSIPKRVPAEDVLHVYMPDRFTGTRGYPWGAAALNTSESARTYDIAELERKKGQSNIFGVVKKPRLAADAANDDGSVEGEDKESKAPEVQPMEPNSVMVIPDDYEFELAQPTATDSNYAPYKREQLSAVAVAFGLAVEHITLNFQYLNDRQYRGAMLEVQRYFESLQYHMLVAQLCEPVLRRFISAAVALELWSLPDGQDLDDVIDGIEWMIPARGYINPIQEIQAFAEAVKNGFTSRKRVSAQFGEDVEDIDAENDADQQRAKGKGLAYSVYPSLDPKVTAAPIGHNGGPSMDETEEPEQLQS